MAMVFPRGTDPAWIPEQRGPPPLKQHLSLQGSCTAVCVLAQSLHHQSPESTRLPCCLATTVSPPQALHTDVTGLTMHTRALQLQQQRTPGILGFFLQLYIFFRETTKKPLPSSGEQCPPRSTQGSTMTKYITTRAPGKLQPQNIHSTCAHSPEGTIQVKLTPISIFSMTNNLHKHQQQIPGC